MKNRVLLLTAIAVLAVMAGIHFLRVLSENFFGPHKENRCSNTRISSLKISDVLSANVDDVFCDDGWASSEVYRVYLDSSAEDSAKRAQVLMQWIDKKDGIIPTVSSDAPNSVTVTASKLLTKEMKKLNNYDVNIQYNLK